MTIVIEFFVGIFGSICGGLIATYIVRFIDEFMAQK